MANKFSTNRRSFAGRSGVKRPTNWIASAIVTANTPLAAATAIVDQEFTAAQIAALAQAGGTIVRTRGILWVTSDQEAATEDPFGAMGMMVVRDQARIAGVAAVPTPVAEAENDGFFVHQWWNAGLRFGSTIGFTGNPWKRYEFDSKAQRKFTSSDAIVVTIENSSSAFGCEFQLQFRMLIKPGVSG